MSLFHALVTWFQPVIRRRKNAEVSGDVKIEVLGQTARTIVHQVNKAVAFVLDISGSMSGEGITNLKLAVTQALNDLPDDTRVTLIVFSTGMQVIANDVALSASTRSDLISRVRRLDSQSSTRFHEPFYTAIEWLKGLDQTAREIILCTDGDSTVDHIFDPEWSQFFRSRRLTVPPQASDDDLMLGLCAQLVALNIPLYVYGMGTAYQEQTLLSWVAAAGGQSSLFHVTSGGAGLQQAIQQSIARLAKAAASDVEIAFVAADGVELVELVRTVPQVKKLDLTSPQLAVDRIGVINTAEGAPYQPVFRFTSEPPLQNGVAVGKVIVTYSSGGVTHTEEFELTVDVTDDPDLVQSRQNHTVAQTRQRTQAILKATAAQSQLTAAATMGDDAAMARARLNLTAAKTMATSADDPNLADLISGMASDDPNTARLSRSRVLSAGVDLDALLDGLEDQS